jgi:DNA-binding NarL/FixJ family response regulator
MRDVRILIVDDVDKWLDDPREVLLRHFGPTLKIDSAKNYPEALEKVRSTSYDLVSVDLELLGEISSSMKFNLLGMDLLKECRSSKRNRACGLMILSGKATASAVSEALKTFGTNEFLDKADYDDGKPYIKAVQDSIRRARLQQAQRQLANCYRLIFTYNRSRLIRGELAGPSQGSESAEIINPSINPPSVDLEELARRADEVNRRLSSGEEGAWRSEARSIGDDLYETISTEPQILSLLATSRALASSREDGALSLHFSGPPSSLSVPYELLRVDGDYLALTHILTRRISEGGTRVSHKSDPFFGFIEKLVEKGEPLRILIAGANTDGTVPAVEEEASRLAASISANLNLLGITPEITPLLGDEVTYGRLKEALRDGQHIFHFAGHGNFDEALPEKSPLILKDRELTAADLNLLTQRTELRFVFLSCCLAARTGSRVGRGDFHGFLHSLSQADVPATLAYRWVVRDDSAIEFATEFYDSLWRNFCLGQALLESRREMALGAEGRDNETWAAPVLLSQIT